MREPKMAITTQAGKLHLHHLAGYHWRVYLADGGEIDLYWGANTRFSFANHKGWLVTVYGPRRGYHIRGAEVESFIAGDLEEVSAKLAL